MEPLGERGEWWGALLQFGDPTPGQKQIWKPGNPERSGVTELQAPHSPPAAVYVGHAPRASAVGQTGWQPPGGWGVSSPTGSRPTPPCVHSRGQTPTTCALIHAQTPVVTSGPIPPSLRGSAPDPRPHLPQQHRPSPQALRLMLGPRVLTGQATQGSPGNACDREWRRPQLRLPAPSRGHFPGHPQPPPDSRPTRSLATQGHRAETEGDLALGLPQGPEGEEHV